MSNRTINLFLFVVLAVLALMATPQPAFTAQSVSLLATLKNALPAKLQKITPRQTTRDDVAKILGKAQKTSKDGTQWYYKTADLEFDTTIGFEKSGLVSDVYFGPGAGFWRSPLTFDDLRSLIAEKDIVDSEKAEAAKSPTHETGRSFTVTDTKSRVRLEFKRIGPPALQSILFY